MRVMDSCAGADISPACFEGKPRDPYDPLNRFEEIFMNEEALNMSLRKFLKVVGVTSQQEIEKAVRAAASAGKLSGVNSLDAQVVLTIGKVNLTHKIDGKIEL